MTVLEEPRKRSPGLQSPQARSVRLGDLGGGTFQAAPSSPALGPGLLGAAARGTPSMFGSKGVQAFPRDPPVGKTPLLSQPCPRHQL